MNRAPAPAPHLLQTAFWRRALLWGSCNLPRSAQLVSMPLWAALPFVLLPRARRQIARNLGHILGPATAPAEAARAYRLLLSFAQSLANSYAAHGGRGARLKADVRGAGDLERARALGRGIIVATGHIGPWQLGPYLLEQALGQPITIAMAREPDAGTQRMEESLELRRRFSVVYAEEPFAALRLLRVLRDGGIVAAQIDRPPPGRNGTSSVLAPFFDGQTSFAAGPILLARASGAPIVPVFLLATSPFGVRVEVGRPVEVERTPERTDDVARTARALARVYEDVVRAHPYQWYAFHDVWAGR